MAIGQSKKPSTLLVVAATLALAWAGTAGSVPAGHRLVGKWYNSLGNGQYIRYQFTKAGAYAYSDPFKMVERTFTIQNDQLTLKAESGKVERYTFRFECIGKGSFSEYMTLRNNATEIETPYVRDPTDPGQRCK